MALVLDNAHHSGCGEHRPLSHVVRPEESLPAVPHQPAPVPVAQNCPKSVSYTHLRAHETEADL
eukprot:926678-Rhodomonas_salina.1